MALLVDYPSSDDDDDDNDNDNDNASDPSAADQPPPAKKHRGPASPKKRVASPTASPKNPTAAPKTHAAFSSSSLTPTPTPTTTLPPLPPAFHNLYAHTTRPSPTDNPALHQNRRRIIPHIQGNWPSHIFIEWHPPPPQHTLLAALLDALAAELAAPPPVLRQGDTHHLTSFLTSDLHAPRPLHVSLSRPFVLRTEQKAAFLAELAAAGRGIAGAAPPFELHVHGLAWFRSREAGRSFLVLRVRSSSSAPQGNGTGTNPELAALLARCNALVSAYGQPQLYTRSSAEVEGAVVDGADRGVQPEDAGGGVDAGDAFHVSIAWSFAEPTADMRARTAALFAREEFRVGVEEGVRIAVGEVKVKIGNVVTSIALGGESRGQRKGGSGLFDFG